MYASWSMLRRHSDFFVSRSSATWSRQACTVNRTIRVMNERPTWTVVDGVDVQVPSRRSDVEPVTLCNRSVPVPARQHEACALDGQGLRPLLESIKDDLWRIERSHLLALWYCVVAMKNMRPTTPFTRKAEAWGGTRCLTLRGACWTRYGRLMRACSRVARDGCATDGCLPR